MPTPLDHPFLNRARERVVILDGAMGTSLHRYKPTDRDWGYSPNGKSLSWSFSVFGRPSSWAWSTSEAGTRTPVKPQ